MDLSSVVIKKANLDLKIRTNVSILAAQNPKFGIYNYNKSLEENINLEASMVSRFDLIFLLLQRPTTSNDKKIATKILDLHRRKEDDQHENSYFSIEFLRKYIYFAKIWNPDLESRFWIPFHKILLVL